MPKVTYLLIALIPAFLFLIAISIIMLILVNHCNLLINMCDQSIVLAVYIAVTLTGITSVSAALIEGVLYHRQTRQSDRQHDEHKKAIKRLEEKIDKIAEDMKNGKSN